MSSERFDTALLPGVTSVGEGIQDGRRVMVVTVERTTKSVTDRIPDRIDGLPTVIEQQAGIRSLSLVSQQSRIGRHRPVRPGVSVGTPERTDESPTGTAAFMMTDGHNEYITGASHVISAVEQLPIGSPVIQPGDEDGGTLGRDQVGTLHGSVPLVNGATVDFAWARTTVDVTPGVAGLGPYRERPLDPNIGDRLIKSGRTTGITRGHVQRVGVVAPVEIPTIGVVMFQDIVDVDMISDNGDSGSPVVIDDGNPRTPTGVVFARSGESTYMYLLTNVIDETDLGLITPAPVDIGDCHVSETRISQGESITVAATVVANRQTNVTVTFEIDGTVVDTQSVTVADQELVESREIPWERVQGITGGDDFEVTASLRT